MPLRSWFVVALASAGALVACNAIIGVEDVKLKQSFVPRADSGPPPGDDDDDDDDDSGEVPFDETERPTIALGYNHGCARMLDSTVRCWGDNGAGQIGDGEPFGGTRENVLRPKSVPNVSDAIAIASGLAHTCIVRKGGAVSCWGVNSFGQLGDGTTNRSSAPVDVIGITNAVAVSGGNSTTCALLADKTISCWGYNGSGNLGDGTKTSSSRPVKVKGVSNAKAVAAAADHTCALVGDGDVVCWGSNATGQLGIGSDDAGAGIGPVKLSLSDVTQVVAAAKFACALEASGRVYCWGANDKGQLGNGAASPEPNPSPILVSDVTDAKHVWAGIDHACAVRATGAVMCWGFAGQGQLGIGAVEANDKKDAPVQARGVVAARAVATGGDRTCVVLADDKAVCFGANTLGQLGNGSTDRALTATPISDFP
ncbi:MAG: hypothetical protein KIT84_41725 [Labilithrix sp.]|nr:hypothetical protein [Labilithrix sp.]MCW5817593.1 hypothetical protein [Labilithrix sp.]